MTYKGESQPSAEADESHFASRVEDESPLPQAFAGFVSLERPLPDGANISPLARARRLAPDGPFVPIARIENQRTVIDLANDAEVHVELAVDHCRGTRLRDGRVVEFDEVELESKNADRETLGRVARELQQRVPGLRPSQETKLGRVMR